MLPMLLFHGAFCPHSRFARLALAERGIEVDLVEERSWERRADFLRLNPEGETPVLVTEAGLAVPGPEVIAGYLEDAFPDERGLMPDDPAARVEVRRLMRWFAVKFFEEVSGPLGREKINKRFMDAEAGGGPPDPSAIRAARSNIRYHLKYVGWLATRKDWLAGEAMTYADLAAAAHFSVADYLGDVPWREDEAAKDWYARVKSRPSFRSLLSDRVVGMAPAAAYANLDF